MCDAHMTENKDATFSYVLSMQNTIFAFLRAIMVPFDMPENTRIGESALLCCK